MTRALCLRRIVLVCVSLSLAAGACAHLGGNPPSKPKPGSSGKLGAREVLLPVLYEENLGQAPDAVRFLHRAAWGTAAFERDAIEFAIHGPLELEGSEVGGSADSQKDPGSPPPPKPPRKIEPSEAVRVTIANVAKEAVLRGTRRSSATGNFYAGASGKGWTRVPLYAGVEYAAALPGTDISFGDGGGGLGFEVALAPAADLARVAFDISGARSVRLDKQGDLELETDRGLLRWSHPRFFATSASTGERELSGSYVVEGHRVRFACAGRDPKEKLRVDPSIGFAGFPGSPGSTWVETLVTTESADQIYVCVGVLPMIGWTDSRVETIYSLRVTDPMSPQLIFATTLSEVGDVRSLAADGAGRLFVGGHGTGTVLPMSADTVQPTAAAGVSKMMILSLATATGEVERATFLGEPDQVAAYKIHYGGGHLALARDPQGDLVVGVGGWIGVTTPDGNSSSTPASPYRGPGNLSQAAFAGDRDACMARLSADLHELRGLQFRGGHGFDSIEDVKSTSNAFVAVGTTNSFGFPTSSGAYQTINNNGLSIGPPGAPSYVFTDSFVAGWTAGGLLEYCTLLGSHVNDWNPALALTPTGQPIVLFEITKLGEPDLKGLAELDAFGATLSFARAWPENWIAPRMHDVGALGDGSAVSIESTSVASPDPISSDAFDSTFAPEGSHEMLFRVHAVDGAPTYVSYLGGNRDDHAHDLAVAANGAVWISGQTTSLDFVSTVGPPVGNAYTHRAFLVRIDDATPVPAPAPILVLDVVAPTTLGLDQNSVLSARIRNVGGGPANSVKVVGTPCSVKALAVVETDSTQAAVDEQGGFIWNVGTLPAGGDRTLTASLHAFDFTGPCEFTTVATSASLPGQQLTDARDITMTGVVADVSIEIHPIAPENNLQRWEILVHVAPSNAVAWPVSVEVFFDRTGTTLPTQHVELHAQGPIQPDEASVVYGGPAQWVAALNLTTQLALPQRLLLLAPQSVTLSNILARVHAQRVSDSNQSNNEARP